MKRKSGKNRFGFRLVTAVIAPALLLALGMTVFAYSALRATAQQADHISVQKQKQGVGVAVNGALDELAQSQSGVAIWNPAVSELRKSKPNWTWFDDNVGTWLNFVFAHDADFILGPDDRPVYAMVNGQRVPPSRFSDFASSGHPLIEAARGRASRAPNPHERLPDHPLRPDASVRTSPRAVHATDLASINGRPAVMSVMRMIPDSPAVKATPGREQLLVSVRYLDAGFVRDLAKAQSLTGARAGAEFKLGPGDESFPLISSSGVRVGSLFWQADRPGRAVWANMAPRGGLALAGLLASLLAMLLIVAKLMQRDAKSLEQLEAAHIELKAREAQAHHLAYHDSLTGLPNRAYFTKVGDQIAAASTEGATWAILLVDLDRFKQVNDTLGHLGGDRLIQQVAKRLEALISSSDIVARLGGDEFAILLADRTSAEEVASVAEAMVAAVRQSFEILGTDVFIGASIGIACHPNCTGDRSEMMRMADIAMYRAKAEGRDSFRFFSEDMDESVQFRREIERDLREAISKGRDLCVYYQPQMDSSGHNVIGFEALMRWNHPQRGFLSPDVFIAVAEETGLIRDLGLWVLRDAAGLAATWPKLSIAVNLSPVQFRMGGFVKEVIGIVREAGAEPCQIDLEVTEGILLDDDEVVRSALRELRSAGFRIALDDFGTGYSSLSYLSKFEVDKIKIDRSFTSRLGEAGDAAAIIQAVVRLGHAMGLSVTAEGVETIEQKAFLELSGCNELQGYLFSPAVARDAVSAFIQGRDRDAPWPPYNYGT